MGQHALTHETHVTLPKLDQFDPLTHCPVTLLRCSNGTDNE